MLKLLSVRQMFATSVLAIAVAVGAGFAIAPHAAAAKSEFYNGDTTFAVDGTDVVAYFTEGKPVEGSSKFTHSWAGRTWAFSTAEHLDLFKANPEKYAPQFGGHCSYAASKGYIASTVPEAWTIVDDKLYLNYSLSVQSRWQDNRAERIASGHRNWPELKAGLLD